MTADTAQADAFAAGQREAAEARRLALVAALHLPPETTWEEALARVVPVPAEVPAKGCHGCRFSVGTGCLCPDRSPDEWIREHLSKADLMTPKPGAPECPGRIER